MKSWLRIAWFTIALIAWTKGNVMAQITLVENGKSDYRIVIPKDAIASEKYAAEELQRYLEKISGAKLPIVTDAEKVFPQEIVLGLNNAHCKELFPAKRLPNLGTDGIFLSAYDEAVFIGGGQPRGVLYGVYAFLEEQLGVRWFTPEVEFVPKKKTITVGALGGVQIPAFDYREDFWRVMMRDGDFAARHRLNGHHYPLTEKHGGRRVVYHPFVHTFDHIIPPTEFQKHPEFFSEINGTRVGERSQLCLTNPDVLRIAKAKVREWIKQHPDASVFSVSQNDNQNYCRCANCRAVDEAEGTPCGTLLKFVNVVAEDIEKDFPDVRIDTLAYQYTRQRPKTVNPRPNVIMRLCSIECCFAHPLGKCPSDRNKKFLADMKSWQGVPSLFVWDYTTNFRGYQQPFPNFDVLQENVKFFRAHGVTGLFEQGNYSMVGHGEMEPLRAYVLAKLLWNPDCDVEKHITEFLNGYYGKAAGKIREYMDLLHAQVRGKDVHTTIFDKPDAAYLTAEFLNGAEKIFDEAEKLAENDDVRFRIQVARLSVQYVLLATNRVQGDARGKMLQQFAAVVRKAGITELQEGRPVADSLKALGVK
jgi:hypothetical protein